MPDTALPDPDSPESPGTAAAARPEHHPETISAALALAAHHFGAATPHDHPEIAAALARLRFPPPELATHLARTPAENTQTIRYAVTCTDPDARDFVAILARLPAPIRSACRHWLRTVPGEARIDVIDSTTEHLRDLDAIGIDPTARRVELRRRLMVAPDPDFVRYVFEEKGLDGIFDTAMTVNAIIDRADAPTAPALAPHLAAALDRDRALFREAGGKALVLAGWKTAAVLIHLGLDLSADARLAQAALPEAAPVLALSGSSHGRLQLGRLEPDLAAMLARPADDAAFYGIRAARRGRSRSRAPRI